MQTRNKVLDDVAQLFSNAMGVAQGARAEAETALKSLLDRWLADRNLVTREEFDAVRAMAQKAREENESLKARLAVSEGLNSRVETLESLQSRIDALESLKARIESLEGLRSRVDALESREG